MRIDDADLPILLGCAWGPCLTQQPVTQAEDEARVLPRGWVELSADVADEWTDSGWFCSVKHAAMWLLDGGDPREITGDITGLSMLLDMED